MRFSLLPRDEEDWLWLGFLILAAAFLLAALSNLDLGPP